MFLSIGNPYQQAQSGEPVDHLSVANVELGNPMKSLLLLLFFMIPMSLNAAEFMFVQSVQAKVMSKPAFKSKQISTLTQSERVEIIEKSKRWYKVRHQNLTGWVSKLLLADQPPLQKSSVLSGSNPTLQENARRRASSNTTAAATRGLREGDQSQENNANKVDYQSVDAMESAVVSPEEAKSFLNERSDH